MKAFFLATSVLAAFLLNAAFQFGAAFAGFGPWKNSLAAVHSNSPYAVGEESTVAWVRLGADAVIYEQCLVWPLVLVLVTSVYMRFARTAPPWHGAVISLAAAPFMLAAHGAAGVLFVCAYAVLLSLFCLLAFRHRLGA
jgi:hypothetical protein